MQDYRLKVEPLGIQNGRARFSVEASTADGGKLLHSDRIDFQSAHSRGRFAKALGKRISGEDDDADHVQTQIETRLLAVKSAADVEAVETQEKQKTLIPQSVVVLGADAAGTVYLYARDTRRLSELGPKQA